MKQHFLPLFYLKHFTSLNVVDGQQPYLWFYKDGQWRRKSPKNLASISEFYSFVDSEGKPDRAYEQLLQRIESDVAPVLLQVSISPPAVMSNSDRQILARFLVLTRFRLPASIEIFADAVAEVYKRIHWLMFQRFSENPDQFEKAKKQLAVSGTFTGEMSVDDLHPDKYEVAIPNAYVLNIFLRNFDKLSHLISKMNWTLLTSKTPQFVSSDYPVVSSTPGANSLHGDGWGHPDVEVSFPLTSKLGLVCSWKGESAYTLAEALSQQIRTINLRTISRSSKINAISASCSFPASDSLSNLKNEALPDEARD